MARPSQFSVRAIAVVLAVAVALSGCATKLRHVPTQALAKQPLTAVESDHRDCEYAITGNLKGAWFPAEIEYASCLISRNYLVWVQVLDASVEVRKASLRTKMSADLILGDMVTCEQFAQDRVTLAEKVGRPMAMAASVFFWPAFIASYAASATLFVFRERDYAACMEPRGYLVTPWRANGEQVSTAPPEARMAP
jgi:hypothetical protein